MSADAGQQKPPADDSASVGILGRGMQMLGLKKKPQSEEEEIPGWYPAQEPMSEQESKSFRRRRATGETLVTGQCRAPAA